MSANLNLSLLKTLKEPIDGVLSQLVLDLQALSAKGAKGEHQSSLAKSSKSSNGAASQVASAAVVNLEELRKVRDSFALGGAYGLSKLLDYALQASELINQQAISKQDVLLLQTTARHLSQLFVALQEHLDFLTKGESLETVLLWPYLYALCEAMKIPTPPPEFLFEPGLPLGPATERGLVDKENFKQTGNKLRQTFQQLCDGLSSCTEKSAVEQIMKKFQELLEHLRSLRPRSNFQAYWLALKGSAAIAQMDTQNVLNQRQEWVNRFKDGLALSEVYLAGGHRFSEDKLYEAVFPLLGEYPKSWIMLNPVIAETRQIFAIDQFKQASIEAKNIEFNQALQEFNHQRPTLKKIIASLRQLWSAVLAGKATKQDFCNNVAVLLTNREKFPTKDFLPLFNSLQALVDRFLQKPEEPIDPQLSDELASVILFLDEAIASSGHWNGRDRQQITLQKQRLDLALSRRFTELAVLPRVEPNFIAHQLRFNATKDLVIHQSHQELSKMREELESLWQGHAALSGQLDPVLENLPLLLAKTQELSHIFAVFHKGHAEQVASLLADKIALLKTARERSNEDLQHIIQQLLGGLLAFLDQWKIDTDTTGQSLLSLLSGSPISVIDSDSLKSEETGLQPVLSLPPVSLGITPSPEQQPEAPTVPLTMVPVTPVISSATSLPAPPSKSKPNSESAESEAELPSDAEIDAELVTSFLDEAQELLVQARSLNQELATHQDLFQDKPLMFMEHLKSLRRVFHTFKGSGKLVGLESFGDHAATYEAVLDAVVNSPAVWSSSQATWLSTVLDFFATWLAQLPRDIHYVPVSLTLPGFPENAPSEPISVPVSTETATNGSSSAKDVLDTGALDTDTPDELELANIVGDLTASASVESSEPVDNNIDNNVDNNNAPPSQVLSGSADLSAPNPSRDLVDDNPVASTPSVTSEQPMAPSLVPFIDLLRQFGNAELDVASTPISQVFNDLLAFGSSLSLQPVWMGFVQSMLEVSSNPDLSSLSLLPEYCLVLASDLERYQAGKPLPSRPALLALLSSSPPSPAPALDWDNIWQGLDTMGDGLQQLVETLSRATASKPTKS